MKAHELRQKSVLQLKEELVNLLKEHFNLKFQRGSGDTPKPHLFKRVRHDIARVKTILHEKEGQ